MQKQNFLEIVDLIRKDDPRYGRGAYQFVREALDFTIKRIEKNGGKPPVRHINGRQLLEGIRDYAVEQFGPMVLTVFDDWNIKRSKDFGEIVFQLVDYGFFGKTEDDRIEDFADGLDFDEAFRRPFLSGGRGGEKDAERPRAGQ